MTNIVYDEYTGKWNLYVDGEWIWEGTYEQCEKMYYNSIED